MSAKFHGLRKSLSKLSVALACGIIVTGGNAQVTPPAVQPGTTQLETQLIAELRETSAVNGARETRFVPATVVPQGHEVHYTVRIINKSTEPAVAPSVVQRIPANTTYVPSSAAGPGAVITFSIDGGQTFAPADALKEVVDGKTQRVPTEKYTHIRWQLRNSLPPGAVALARFRAVFR